MSRAVHILVIEDDPSIALGLRVNLEAEGYRVTLAADGEQGLAAARAGCDLLILDLMMPIMNGFELLRILRAEQIETPAIILSALSAESDKVTGLDLGAQDFVTKPFSLAELLARIRSVLRRRAASSSGASSGAPTGMSVAQEPPLCDWSIGENVEVKPSSREVFRAGILVSLTRTEFDILVALHQAEGAVLTRSELITKVWGPAHKVTTRTVDNFLAQLRAKLDDPEAPHHLLTVRGVGYRLAP